ncbi:hypothetical protein SKAU_G00113910 [Synaphobranchus kaupii]|uniref:Uncharacterized protein n=1 Tax=Synaphobranchus kaupii TaxID=118154 RepID=A0A9Q1G0V9_SYNKA|nr:hypothetical protein SKAU_G00113910 [Synaphobranchus kaupii]
MTLSNGPGSVRAESRSNSEFPLSDNTPAEREGEDSGSFGDILMMPSVCETHVKMAGRGRVAQRIGVYGGEGGRA